MKDNTLNFDKYFSAHTVEDWRQAATKALKGKPLEKLTYHSYEGFEIEPLMWDFTEDIERGYPDLFPRGRGSNVFDRRVAGWDIRESYDQGELEDIAGRLTEAKTRGVRSFWLIPAFSQAPSSSTTGLPIETVSDLEKLLKNIDLRETPIAIEAGMFGLGTLGAYLTVAAHQGVSKDQLTGAIHFDPLGFLARHGRLPMAWNEAWQELADMLAWTKEKAPHLQVVTFSALPYHDGGANAIQEIAAILSSAVETFRQLEKQGFSLEEILPHVILQVGVGRDLFMEIAKLRALRILWSYLLEASGVSREYQKVFIHACALRTTKTKRDPWVNMLRGTAESFSAIIGGADALTLLPYDSLWGTPEPKSYRIASNTQVILAQESYLNQVIDPAGGSWYIETLTDKLIEGAWELFRSFEEKGGMASMLTSGQMAEEIEKIVELRQKAIAKRKEAIVGVSEFANLQEQPLERPQHNSKSLTFPHEKSSEIDENWSELSREERQHHLSQFLEEKRTILSTFSRLHPNEQSIEAKTITSFRLAAQWEALRDKAERYEREGRPLKVFLGNLGSIPEHKARAEFAKQFFAAGGFQSVENDGFSDADALVQAFEESEAQGLVLCGKDEAYLTMVEPILKKLKNSQARFIALAGRPKENEEKWRQDGITHFIYLGCNALQLLQDIQQKAGDKR